MPPPPAKPPLPNNLRTPLTYLKRPKHTWLTLQPLGTLGGGLNAGIATTRLQHDPQPHRIFIEKRFRAQDVAARLAHREIALLRQVGDHAHVTRMYDHFVDEGVGAASVYLEFCEGGSVGDVLGGVGGWVGERRVWEWWGQVLGALVYCHLGAEPEGKREVLDWAAVYHRDIKPGNILLTRDATKTRIIAKLADFGCAISDEWTYQTKHVSMASHASAQTPGYDPPEFPKFSGASDVWQLALVFVCVCNRQKEPPRSRMNPSGKQWDRERPAGPHYSQQLSRALGSCLIEDMQSRPGSLKSLKDMTVAYNSIRQTLPVDPHPLEIFERSVIDKARTRDAVPSSGSERQMVGSDRLHPMASLTPGQLPHRPGLPGHIMSDPESGRPERMLYNYADFLSSPRSPQEPYSGGPYPRDLLYLEGDWDEEEEEEEEKEEEEKEEEEKEEEDCYYGQGTDPSIYGGQYQYQGFYPPLHPRRSRHGRR